MDDQKTATPTPQELDKMSFSELREIAKSKNIDYVGLTPKQLKFKLGAAPEGAVVFNLAEGLTDEIIRQREEKKERVPTKIIYPKDIEDQIWKIREFNPDAFDGVDFTDKEAPIQHIFTKRVKCTCGETVVMERRLRQRRDKEQVEVVDPSPVYKKQCTCGKWYIYHTKDDYEIHAKI